MSKHFVSPLAGKSRSSSKNNPQVSPGKSPGGSGASDKIHSAANSGQAANAQRAQEGGATPLEQPEAAVLDDRPSRYIVGIDLGTTNSAVAFVDTEQTPWRVESFPVKQLTAPGQVEARKVFPSFHYQPTPGELPPGALRLPWSVNEPAFAVGMFARDHGAGVSGRMIASAKSWLCHSGVNRTADLLPWHGAADVERLSPVEVSARYLRHLHDAWNYAFPTAPLSAQDVVLTLPASFDEVARELTVAAAARAGLPRVVLIEEPQAAFYSWIDRHSNDWEFLVSPGQKILVCDVGGGTTDFTLIRVRLSEDDKIQFHRVAVGDHLILGGDNFDLALAQYVERKLMGDGKLPPRQWDVLLRVCRTAKETMLSAHPPATTTLTLPGVGSRVIGGGLQVELTREEIQQTLLDGFLPHVKLTDKPANRRSGFQEFGLPYAPDPAITRYLASFLLAHRRVALEENEQIAAEQRTKAGVARQVSPPDAPDVDPARPDIVLFNGGVFESPLIRERLLETLCSWFPSRAGDWKPLVLENDQLDLAVARGAAYYGMVRRGRGVRIAAGLARTYYIGVDADSPSAMCLAPANAEPGQSIDLTSRVFSLRVAEPVEFPLYVSSTRLTDRPGQLFPIDPEQMTALPPIRTVLRTKKNDEAKTVSVQIHARLTEIGTLDLWCGELSGPRRWRLQFDVRAATQTDREGHSGQAELAGFLDEAAWDACHRELAETFGPQPSQRPDDVMKRLATVSGMSRWEWPPSLLRRMWEHLIDWESARKRGPAHEARWLNLLGFSLRPGYGLAVDDWRVQETWRTLFGKLAHPTDACRTEWWILWRRIAGGLSAGQQQALATPLVGAIRSLHRQQQSTSSRGSDYQFAPQEAHEVWRLIGSLELLDVATKIELGWIILNLLPKKKLQPTRPALLWTLGRLGARCPVYGPLNGVPPADVVTDWLNRLIVLLEAEPLGHLAIMQMARRTGDRYRDLETPTRDRMLYWLERQGAAQHLIDLVKSVGELDVEEQGQIFGEALPKGLRIE